MLVPTTASTGTRIFFQCLEHADVCHATSAHRHSDQPDARTTGILGAVRPRSSVSARLPASVLGERRATESSAA